MEKVIHIIPGEEPFELFMPMELEDLQRFVGGYIETVTLDENTVLIVDEDGKNKAGNPNFVLDYGRFGYDIVVGNAIICGFDGDEFTSIDLEKAKKIIKSLTNMNKIEVKR